MDSKIGGSKMTEIRDSLSGEKVRLIPLDAERDSVSLSLWHRNSEYSRLLDSDPATLYSSSATKKWLEENELAQDYVAFAMQSKADGKILGEIGLSGFSGNFTNAFVGLGIGDPQYWGRGYGSDAMLIILRYAFEVLNLHRVTLSVFEYNPRAIHSYEKCGFKHEGRMREALGREGKRWDILFMGITSSEWQETVNTNNR
jgi:RimJ/RimL family protein N-acetyltransferase